MNLSSLLVPASLCGFMRRVMGRRNQRPEFGLWTKPSGLLCFLPCLLLLSVMENGACAFQVPFSTAVSVHPEALLQQKLAPELQFADGDVNEDFLCGLYGKSKLTCNVYLYS